MTHFTWPEVWELTLIGLPCFSHYQVPFFPLWIILIVDLIWIEISERGLGHKDISLINRLTPCWTHSWMRYSELGTGYRRKPRGRGTLKGVAPLGLWLCCLLPACYALPHGPVLEPAGYELKPLKPWAKVDLSPFKLRISDVLSQQPKDD